jgi:outer membrane protein assembly factor BamD (BamD/ComL family)
MGSRVFRACCLFFLACAFSGCVYFNTYYNAAKAYDQAVSLHEKRLDKNPEDSVLVSPEEKIKLDRCITKASKVLELYPDKPKYQPKALFLIGESYLALGEYSKAITKYEELARFYPQAEERPTSDFHHAKALFLNGQYPFARTSLEKVIANTPNPAYRAEAMIYLAQLEVKNNSPEAALDLYEKLLTEKARTRESKGNVHFEAAKLAFDLKQWERARGHAKAQEIKYLPSRLRYRCDMLAADCLFRQGKTAEGIAELEGMLKNRLYATFEPEIDLKLAEGFFQLGKADKAVDLLKHIPPKAPKTAYSAEAFFRLGEYHLRSLKDEKQAKVFYDSAAAAGIQFEYGALAQERSQALGRLTELRAPADTAAAAAHYRDFMIAELFLFRLDNVDSALGRLDRIVSDKRQDSTHTMRAAYARAFIQEEFKKAKPAGDSLYRYVMEKYPNTEYAKQAEKNLGEKPTVQTDEDKAHKLFLEAEAVRFGGSGLSTVVPAYRKVTEQFPKTREAAKAQFVVAMLFNDAAFGEEKVPGALDSAKTAFVALRDRYPQSPYFPAADAKLAAAGIKATPVPVPAKPADGKASPAAAPARGPSEGGEREEIESEHPEPAAVTDSTSEAPEGKHKEEMEKDYDNVDQY